MEPVHLSTATVSELTGASLRMLDHWARTGLLPPTGRVAKGKGSRRSYTFQDVIAVLTVCKLRERKCPLQQIRSAVRYLRTHYPEAATSSTLAKLTLLTDGKTVYLLTSERQVMNVVTRQWVWSVPLGLLIAEASQKIETLPREWTERVTVGRRSFRLLVTQATGAAGDYLVRCRELPGLLQRAASPAQAVSAARETIESLLFLSKRERDRSGGQLGQAGVA